MAMDSAAVLIVRAIVLELVKADLATAAAAGLVVVVVAKNLENNMATSDAMMVNPT